MIFKKELIKIGDSYGIIIPKDALSYLDWEQGAELLIQVSEIGQINIKKSENN